MSSFIKSPHGSWQPQEIRRLTTEQIYENLFVTQQANLDPALQSVEAIWAAIRWVDEADDSAVSGRLEGIHGN